MTQRISTIRLSIEDAFSGPLAAYVAGMGQADAATAKAAADSQQSAQATDQLTNALSRTTTVEIEMAGASRTASTAAQDQTGANKNLNLSLLDVYAAVGLARQGYSMLKGAYDEVIGSTLAYADQVRQLHNTTGITTDDASKLIYAANQTGVSFQSLSTGIEAAIRSMGTAKSAGIEPNIQGLGQLSDEYLAIQDPIARTKFLLDNFGRSGADLEQLMLLGSAGLKSLGDQATATGNVMGGSAVDAMYKYEQETKKVGAEVQGLKISLTELLLPAIQGVTGMISDRLMAVNMLNTAFKDGSITAAQYAVEMGMDIATGGFKATQVIQDMTNAEAKHTAMVNTATQSQAAFAQAVTVATGGFGPAKAAIDALAQSNDNFITKLKTLTGAQLDQYLADQKVIDATNKFYDAQNALSANIDSTKADALRTAVVNAASAMNAAQDAAYKLDDQLTQTDSYFVANSGAAQKYADAIQALADKEQAAADKSAVAAGVAGTLEKNQDAYSKVVDASTPKLALLRDQLDKLVASQGMVADATTKSKYTDDQMQIAQDRNSLAAQKLADAQAKLDDAMAKNGTTATVWNAAHTKSHQVTLDTTAAIHTLSESLQSAKIAYEGTQATLETYGATTSGNTQVVIDNSTAIGKLKDQIWALTLQESQAKDAMKLANDQFLYQQIASHLNADQQLEAARILGTIDEKTYKYAKTAVDAAVALQTGTITQSQFNAQLSIAKDAVNGVITPLGQLPGVLTPATSAFDAQAQKVQNAALALHQYHGEEDGLYSKTITITTVHDDVYNSYSGGGGGQTRGNQGGPGSGMGGGSAGGGSTTPPSIVPPVIIPPTGGGTHPGPQSNAPSGPLIGSVNIYPAAGDSGEAIWQKVKVAAAREARGLILAGAAGMGSS